MSIEPFIPPAPTQPDHRRAALSDALDRLNARLESEKAYLARKDAESDEPGRQHALGTVTGLLVARDLIRSMMGGARDA